MYVVVSTAVLPYSDDGACGQGVLVECIDNEADAVHAAVQMMQTYVQKLMPVCGEDFEEDCSTIENAQSLCQDGLKLTTFATLSPWYDLFRRNLHDHVNRDPNYGNPGHVLSLTIKECATSRCIISA